MRGLRPGAARLRAGQPGARRRRRPFIGFAVQDGREASEALLDRTGVTFTIADDPDAAFADGFGSLAMPTTAIIDADGVVVDVHSGQLTADELRDRLAEVLS